MVVDYGGVIQLAGHTGISLRILTSLIEFRATVFGSVVGLYAWKASLRALFVRLIDGFFLFFSFALFPLYTTLFAIDEIIGTCG